MCELSFKKRQLIKYNQLNLLKYMNIKTRKIEVKRVNKNNFLAYCNKLGITTACLSKKFGVKFSTAKLWLERVTVLRNNQMNWVNFRLAEFNKEVANLIKNQQEKEQILICFKVQDFEKYGNKKYEFFSIQQAIYSEVTTITNKYILVRFNENLYLKFLKERKSSELEVKNWAENLIFLLKNKRKYKVKSNKFK